MNANNYIDLGHCFVLDGWTVTLDDGFSGGQCPVAIHHDTARVMELEWEQAPDCWTQDWQSSPLDADWDDFAALVDHLQDLFVEGRLRVAGAIHGLPGASELGALFC